ncbi:MAG TPA: hypothetical protein PLJ35_04480 [Anaerolineae bacterium]|nr:hypothetical protein [Anaerolineae bacterium]
MYDAIRVEELDKPAVVIVNAGFVATAKTAASGRGMPGVRIIASPVIPNCIDEAEVDAGITPLIKDIVAGLTKPLSAEEKAPSQKEEHPRIVFRGTLKEVNRFFYKRGWTDGLPVLPPTEEEVAEMLSGTDLPPDHVVGQLIPRLGKVTVERIAINAVMAGALPTHMPVLIAAAEILMDRRVYFGQFGVSTGSFAPMWLINGPIRNDLRINCKTGILSPGDIANSGIGRAISLIIKNIGGIRKGVEDMGVMGNPGKIGMVVGENEEESPWDPLHVDHGLAREDSAITVHFMDNSQLITPYHVDDNGILRVLIDNINPGRQLVYTIIFNAETARILSKRGWSKQDVREFISEYARVPAYQHRVWERVFTEASPNPWGLRRQQMPISPMETMRIIPNPDWIRVFVAGGPLSSMGLYGGDHFDVQKWVTKKIQLPANWNKLVAKYKNIVPNYSLY